MLFQEFSKSTAAENSAIFCKLQNKTKYRKKKKERRKKRSKGEKSVILKALKIIQRNGLNISSR